MSAEVQHSAPIGILFATGTPLSEASPTSTPLKNHVLGLPGFLLPALGKSLLQRALEMMIDQGCRNVHIILGEEANPVREFLDDGKRWGCSIDYHYQHPSESISKFLKRIGIPDQSALLVGDASCLPLASISDIHGNFHYSFEHHGRHIWSGWCRTNGWSHDTLKGSIAEFSHALTSLESMEIIGPAMSAANLMTWHSGCMMLLSYENGTGELRPGKDSMVHASARIIPPVRIAENVRVGANCHIGPNAILEAGVIVGKDTYLSQSIILPDTFVGEHLNLTSCIARGGKLANISIESLTQIRDRDVLAGPVPINAVISVQARILAALVKLALFPIYALSIWRLPNRETLSMGFDVERVEEDSCRQLKHFAHDFYPGLNAVMRGELGLVGPRMRDASTIAALAQPWQRLYHDHHSGLLQEALLNSTENLDADDLLASDALATMQQHDTAASMKLLWMYIKRVMNELVN